MSYTCSICSEYLDRAPMDLANTSGANIACVPCGHLFHTFCIDKWMSSEYPTSKHCPYCRKEIEYRIPLFPTIREHKRHDSVQSDRSDSSNHNSFAYDQELLQLQKKMELLELKERDLEEISKALRNEQEMQVDKVKHQLDDLKKSVELCARFKGYCRQLEQRWENVEADVASLQCIQSVIESLETHVDDMGDFPVTKESVDSLKNINAILTMELQDSLSQTKEAQEQQMRLLQSNSKANAKIKVLNDTTASLEHKVASFKNELEEFQRLNQGIYLWDQ